MQERKPFDTKELRKKYGIYGLSIIQIVGLIFIVTIAVTVLYNIL